MAIKAAARFTVSGPDIDKSYEEYGPALSRAITAASRLLDVGDVYVRDPDGEVVARVHRDADSGVTIFCGALAKAAA